MDCPAAGGAVFTIALPVDVGATTAAHAVAPGEADASHRKILIVDDELEIRETLGRHPDRRGTSSSDCRVRTRSIEADGR